MFKTFADAFPLPLFHFSSLPTLNKIVNTKLHSILTDMWRLGSSPWRRFRMQQMVSAGNVPIFVLFYHRVADSHPNPWSMTNSEFEQQIRWFQNNFDLVSMEEVQKRVASGSNARPTISITFDDGYAENCDLALPFLIEEGIPVTYFVTTQHTSQQVPFPHDVENGRSALSVNTIEQLRAMANAGIEIGAHTRTHINLGTTTDPETIYDEVITATRELERFINREIKYFAFPYGQYKDMNAEVFHLLKQHGFKGVCSAYGGWNEVGDDPFHIQRIHGDPNFTRMRNWLTYDPRFAKVQRYDYSRGSVDWANWVQPETKPVNETETNKDVVISNESADTISTKANEAKHV